MQIAKGRKIDVTQEYYPIVEVTCPVCSQITMDQRHVIDLRGIFDCSHCGVVFKVIEWEEEGE